VGDGGLALLASWQPFVFRVHPGRMGPCLHRVIEVPVGSSSRRFEVQRWLHPFDSLHPPSPIDLPLLKILPLVLIYQGLLPFRYHWHDARSGAMATAAANKRVRQMSTGANRAILIVSSKLTREYANIQRSPPPYIVAHPSEANILEFTPPPLSTPPTEADVDQMALCPDWPSRHSL
jgi:hypothetical protein